MLEKLKTYFNKPFFAYLSIVGGFIVQLTLGSVYTYGNMFPYLLCYMKNHTRPYNSINTGTSMWIFGLLIFGFGGTISFGGYMIKRIGTIPTILSGSWLMSFGVLVTYWTINTHLAAVAITYGLIVGLGVGLTYGTIISIPSEWFPDSKGLVTGIVVAGFGISPITLDFIQSKFINPELRSIKCSDNGVQDSFLLMGTIYAIMQLIGSIMIRRPETNEVQQIEQDNDVNNHIFPTFQIQRPEIKTKPIGMIIEKDFWILWLSYTLNTCVSILILSLHKDFGTIIIKNDDLFLTVATAFGAGFNGIGRIVWGYLIDRFTYKSIMTILTLWMSVMIGTFYTCSLIRNILALKIMYFIWVIKLHFLLSGNFSIYPVICNRRFGMANGVVNYGILFTAYALSGIIVSSVATAMLVDSALHLYFVSFLVGCGLSLLSALFVQMYRGNSYQNNSNIE